MNVNRQLNNGPRYKIMQDEFIKFTIKVHRTALDNFYIIVHALDLFLDKG